MDVAERQLYASVVRAALRQRPISSKLHDALAKELTASLTSALLEPAGARTILALSAPNATGKTTCIKRWAQELYLDWTGTGVGDAGPVRQLGSSAKAELTPVVYLTLLSAARSKDLYSQLLAFLNYPMTGVQRAVADRAVNALANHGVRLVILDDAHMLRVTNSTGRQTLDAIKHLNTELGELGGVLFLVGANITNTELLDDPQVAGRLAEHTFHPYGATTGHERRLWQDLLFACEKELADYLPHDESGFAGYRNAGYLWRRTQGFIGDTTRLLIDGAAIAIAENRKLSRDILDRVPTSRRAQQGQAEAARTWANTNRSKQRPDHP